MQQQNLLERFAIERLGVSDLETLRLIVRGDSVIDWKRLHFQDRAEVDHFLRQNLFDLTDKADERRARAILAQAVAYLRNTFRYRVAAPVAHPEDIRDLFLLASGVLEPRRLRRIACVVLKVMHTVHHVEARELLFRARVSEVELSHLVDGRVREVVERLRDEHGLPVERFEGNSKTRESIITKLISKREHVAATVYDRHRYRVIVKDRASLVTTVLALGHELFPFNYVVPGQTQNSLVSLEELVEEHPALRPTAMRLSDFGEDGVNAGRNEFSGKSYRILNFIVDLPLRIDATVLSQRREREEDLGRIVFAPVELQVLDVATADANESGENSHVRYKKRQLRRVLGRLSRGLVVPKKRHKGGPNAPRTDGGAGA